MWNYLYTVAKGTQTKQTRKYKALNNMVRNTKEGCLSLLALMQFYSPHLFDEDLPEGYDVKWKINDRIKSSVKIERRKKNFPPCLK